MENQRVTLDLSHEQALVFYEWLSKLNAAEGKHFDDQAEERVLWDIEAMLESVLQEPIGDRYRELLETARSAVRDSTDDG